MKPPPPAVDPKLRAPTRRPASAARLWIAVVVILALLLVALVLLVLLALAKPSFFGQRATSTVSPAREVVSDSLNVLSTWTRNDLVLAGYYTDSALACAGRLVAAVSYLPDRAGQEVVVLDGHTGTNLWKAGPFGIVNAMWLNQGLVFAVEDWRLVAARADTGEVLWTSTALPDRTSYRIGTTGSGRLSLWYADSSDSHPVQIVRTYDEATGSLLSVEEIPSPGDQHLELASPDMDLWSTDLAIAGTTRGGGRHLWTAALKGPMGVQPLLARGALLLIGGLPFELRMVDAASGAQGWVYPFEVESNVAAEDGVAYVLGADGRLVALDLSSGVEEGSASFRPALPLTEGWLPTNWVAVCDDRLYVYLDDGNELLALAAPRH